MNSLMHNSIVEYKDNQHFSYTFNDESLFSDTGFRVLKTKENDFIKGVRVTHNGKIKIIYDISKYKLLDSVINRVSPSVFLSMILKLFDILYETRNNGFLNTSNINVDFDKILVDENNSIFLIYVPINIDQDKTNIEHENILNRNIISAISQNQNIKSPKVIALYHDLGNQKSFDQVYKSLKDIICSDSDEMDAQEISLTGAPTLNQTVSQIADVKKSKIMDLIFSNKSSNKGDKKKKTSGLGAEFRPSIILSGINGAKNSFVITKPEYAIGKNANTVDGLLDIASISRLHCKIVWLEGSNYIMDLGSLNGTFVNSKRINQGDLVPIVIGDLIALGRLEFTVKNI